MNLLQAILLLSIFPATCYGIGFYFERRTKAIHKRNKIVRAKNAAAETKNRIDAEIAYVNREMYNTLLTKKVPVIKTSLPLQPGEFVTRRSEGYMHLLNFDRSDFGDAYLTNRRIVYVGAELVFDVALEDIVGIEEDIELGSITIKTLKSTSAVVLTVDHPLMWRRVFDSFNSKYRKL